MHAVSHCSKCGAEIPRDAPRGFCPRCLYRLGFEDPVALNENGFSLAPAAETQRRNTASVPPLSELGDYQLLEEIGYGGMGIVYRGRQKSLNRIVAVKLLLLGPHATADSIKRFRVEAAATAALQHPNIVAIHEVGFSEGQHFITMDYVEGQSLSQMIRANPLAPRRAAGYLKAIAQAIHHAHEHGILHRDLKPANVLIDHNDQPRITDFGLAKRLADSPSTPIESQVTLSGQILGSPNYLPPEQAAGKRGLVSRRSDVYSLGAILYEALTGRPPFIGESMVDTVQQVLKSEPVAPHLLNPGVPSDLEQVCLKCLEKEPAKRYATAELFVDDLNRYLQGMPVLAKPVGRTAKAWRWCRRNPQLASMAGVLAVVVSAAFALVLVELHRARIAEIRAHKNAYIADMNLAQRALDESNVGRARFLLERYNPTSKVGTAAVPAIPDLRGWEWRWLWRRSRTHERATLMGASNLVHAVAFSPDGKFFAALSSRDHLRLWDRATGEWVARKSVVSSYRNHVLFAADSRSIFLGSYEGCCVKILAVPSLEEIGQLRHQHSVNWLAMSGDGRLLATEDSAEIKIWDATTLRELGKIAMDRDLSFGRVALSPDGRLVAFSDYTGRLYVWEWAVHKPLAEFEGHARVSPWVWALHDLAFTPDGARLLSTGPDRALILWDIASGRKFKRLEGHSATVIALAFSPSGAVLATTSGDQTVRLWDTSTWELRSTLLGHANEVWDAAFSPDGQELATVSKDETLKLWDGAPPPDRRLSLPLPPQTARVVLAAESGKAGVLQQDGTFKLLDTRNWAEQCGFRLPINGTNRPAIALDPQGTCLAVGSDAGHVSSWLLPVAIEGPAFEGHLGPVESLAFSEDGQILASAGTDRTLRVWRTDTRRQIAQFPKESPWVLSLVLSPGGRLLGVSFADFELEIWDIESGRRRARFVPHKMIHELAFLRNPCRFVTGSGDGTVKLWDLGSLRQQEVLRGSLHGVNSLVTSWDDRTLITGTGEGLIKVWDLETLQEVAVLKGHRESVEQLALSRDGRTFLSVSQDAARVWEAPTLKEIEAAQQQTPVSPAP